MKSPLFKEYFPSPCGVSGNPASRTEPEPAATRLTPASSSSNFIKPDVPIPQIPTAFLYLGSWFLLAGAVYYFLGFETSGRSIEDIYWALLNSTEFVTRH